MTASFVVDVAKRLSTISPLLFGHNLEHTRSSVWHGLSAEIIRNRKFMGCASRDGVAEDWYPIGQPRAYHIIEIGGGANGSDGEPYTGHFQSEKSPGTISPAGTIFPVGHRQRIESPTPGCRAGIGQSNIVLVAGRSYKVRAVLRSDRPLAATISLIPGKSQETHLSPNAWTETAFDFTAPQSISDAKIEITLEGPGNLYVGAVSLLPADHFHGIRRDVIDRLRDIGAPMLRWPGGNFAGDYLWRDGLLPVDRRAAIRSDMYTLPHTHCFDNHEIGTDEFIALCRELSAEPFLTINMSLEGPEEAAAWVEYCNGSADSKWGRLRAERGHPEPYNVRYWTLGNEMGYSHMKGSNGPAEYAKAAAACAKAMRQVDPSLILVASAAWHKDWYEGVLAASDENFFDHLSFHIYHPALKTYIGEEGRAEFRRLANAPFDSFFGTGVKEGKQEVRLSFPDMRRLLNARPRGRKDIGIAFDEWNVWYAWVRTPGVSEAIHGALMYHLFCREAANVGMTIGSFFEPVNEGAILVGPESARLTSLGKVMNLFKPHHGARLLAVDVAQQGDLDVIASMRPDSNQITITIVNRSADKDGQVEIVLQNTGNLAAAEAVILTAPDFLPGTELSQAPAKIHRDPLNALALSLPRHSVARITVQSDRPS